MKKITITKKEGATYAKVSELFKWKDNPRGYERKDFERLKKQLELGEHSPLLVSIYGEVLGGNTRLDAYKALKKSEAMVVPVEIVEREGRYHVIINDQLSQKSFETEGQAKLELALSHNESIGYYDETKLAEQLQLHPIETELYKIPSVFRPIEDVAFEAGVINPEDRPQDIDQTDDKLDTFMNGNIKQIVFYFDNDQYEDVMPRITKLREELGLEDNTNLFMELLAIGEQHVGTEPDSTD